MEPYKTVEDIIRGTYDWGTLALVTDLDPSNQAARLRDLFIHAARSHDDTGALKMFGFLTSALRDRYMVPLLREEGLAKVLPYNSEADAKFRKEVAVWVGSLWEHLPVQQPGASLKPTLLKTREKMLTEVAWHWRTTKDENDADTAFRFLIGIKMSFTEEQNILRDVIKTALGPGGLSSRRLLRHYLEVASSGRLWEPVSGLSNMLVNAWVRNTDGRTLHLLLKSVEPLLTADGPPLFPPESQPEFDLLRDTAEWVAKLRVHAPSLREAVQWVGDNQSRMVITFPNRDSIHLVRVVKWPYKESFAEGDGYRLFRELRDRLERWHEDHPILLQWSLRVEYGVHNPEVLFSRDGWFSARS